MGLLKFIEHNLPYEWEVAAKEQRCKRDLCQRIYDALPPYFKGNHLRDKDRLRRAYACIRKLFQGELIHAIDVTNTEIEKWKAISERVNQIKEECR